MAHSVYEFQAVVSAYASILCGAVAIILSILAGREDFSLSLYGIALLEITDISGDILVLTIWQRRKDESEMTSSKELRAARASQKVMEAWSSFTIGVFLLICGMFLCAERQVVGMHIGIYVERA